MIRATEHKDIYERLVVAVALCASAVAIVAVEVVVARRHSHRVSSLEVVWKMVVTVVIRAIV